ncbi:Protein takeout [Pseudolycoriella hygida]|uniref:Protein takeout n=1 Tax=Pseudolycoriella hygida TaxID=35572 RepID=A0A9Q0ML46_9DIPT|nr:Protein takeout [Pseudolycoriella hygida]
MSSLRELTFLFLLVLVANVGRCSDDFPVTIERCRNEDKECLKKTWNKYVRLTKPNGIPELDVPNINEYFVKKSTLSPGGGPVDIVLKMKNIVLTGLDNVYYDDIIGFPKDPKEMTQFELIGRCPELGLKGKYNVTGKILLLPVSGDGDGEVNLYNIKFNITALTSTEMVDGKEYLVITKVICNYESQRNKYRFENLLHNKELSDSINLVVNQNQEVINPEIKGPSGALIAEHFKKILSAVFKKYPYSSFFLQD